METLSLIKAIIAICMDNFRSIWKFHLGQSMQNHWEIIGVQALQIFRQISTTLDQYGQVQTNLDHVEKLGQSKTNLENSP